MNLTFFNIAIIDISIPGVKRRHHLRLMERHPGNISAILLVFFVVLLG